MGADAFSAFCGKADGAAFAHGKVAKVFFCHKLSPDNAVHYRANYKEQE
jgi:hypothetical protein